MKEANREVLDRGSLPEMLVNRARQSSDRRAGDQTRQRDCSSAVSIAQYSGRRSGSRWRRSPSPRRVTALWGILDREVAEVKPSIRGARVCLPWARGSWPLLGAARQFFGLPCSLRLLGPMIS